MAEFPALPLFTDAYLADTRHLTTIQHGAYLLMLMTAWRSGDCTLPNDDVYLARICGMDKRTWAANKATLLQFWCDGGNAKLFQKRLKDERKYVEQKRNKNSEAGRASALKRLNRGSTSVQPERNETSTPTPTPTPIYKERERERESNADALPLPRIENFMKKEKGTRLPDEWELQADLGEWAMTQGLTRAEVLREEEKFKAYYLQLTGPKSYKNDWGAAFRMWIMRIDKNSKVGGM